MSVTTFVSIYMAEGVQLTFSAQEMGSQLTHCLALEFSCVGGMWSSVSPDGSDNCLWAKQCVDVCGLVWWCFPCLSGHLSRRLVGSFCTCWSIFVLFLLSFHSLCPSQLFVAGTVEIRPRYEPNPHHRKLYFLTEAILAASQLCYGLVTRDC